MEKAYTMHIDDGHAWAEVPLRDILAVGLDHASFSSFSYAHIDKLYRAVMFLEEDIDMQIFLNAAHEHGITVIFKEKFHKGDAPVRCYCRNTSGGGPAYIKQRNKVWGPVDG